MKSILENFDYSVIPQHTLSLKGLHDPKEIGQWFAYHDIRRYVYNITAIRTMIKIGCSPSDTKYRGDRVYSQIGQLPSWNTNLIRGSGSEFLHIADDYKRLYGQDLDHNDITIRVLDFTDHITTFNPRKELEQHETEQMRRFKVAHGFLPMGNHQFIESKLYQTFTTQEQFNKMFMGL